MPTAVKTLSTTRRRKLYRRREDVQDALLDVIRRNGGNPTNLSAVARMFGYTQPSVISRIVRELEDGGTLTKVGGDNYHGFIYMLTTEDALDEPAVPKKERKLRKPKTRLSKKGQQTRQRLLSVIRTTNEQPVSQVQLAQRAGLSATLVWKYVLEMEREGLIERSMPAEGGTRYRVVEASKEEPGAEQGPNLEAPEVPMTNEQAMISLLEPLALDYVKLTGDTNLFHFMRWLSSKEG